MSEKAVVKDAGRKRIIGLRLTGAEFGELEKNWKKSTVRKLSEYVRRILFGKRITVYARNQSLDELVAELMVLRRELHAIGVNFNQAVHRLNMLDHAPQMQAWLERFGRDRDRYFALFRRSKNEDQFGERAMVAVVHHSKSLRGCLNYNEHKVKAGLAKCLEAGFYPMDAGDMSFQQKLRRLELLTELNQRTKVNSVHISLNFHPSEKPSEDLIKEISAVFLEKIGFGGQPYLLYQHFDAGHPHIHLVTTNIKADGKAINLHDIGRVRAQQARLEIEKAYGLVVAGKEQQNAALRFKPVNVQRALYGRMETKRAMNGIINVVCDQYRFTSLAQFNAVLGLYNIVADTGGEGSRVNKHEGLVFRVLDEGGDKVGVPIKASDFASKPTLKNLREKFTKNEGLKQAKKNRVANAVNLALLHGGLSLEGLQKALQEKAIDLVIRQNADGVVYGLTYVDHQQKVVFNGSELGKAFSAKAILERCPNLAAGEGKKQNGKRQKPEMAGQANAGETRDVLVKFQDVAGVDHDISEAAEALLVDGGDAAGMDWELKRTKRRKKKRVRLSPG